MTGVRTVRHAGIVVRDVERSLRFYRDQLGLEVQVDQRETGEFISELLGRTGVSVRTVKLSAPEGPTLVELLEFEDGGQDGEGLANPTRLGPTHVALTVDALDELYGRLQAEGTPFVSPPLRSPDGKALVAFCTDPDGSLIELVEPTAV
jgi:lactoylglutathione lyase